MSSSLCTRCRVMNSQRSPILFVVLLALIVRGAVALLALSCNEDSSVFFEPYSPQYLKPAVSLLRWEGFTVEGRPEIRRTPGYPLLLIPGLALNNVPLVTIVLQLLLSCLTVYLVYRIGLLLFGRINVAAGCALLYAVEPLSVVFSPLIMPETSLTCALSAFLFFLVRYLHGGSMGHVIASGGAAAVSAYINPITLYLPFVMALGGVIHALRKRKGTLVAPALVLLAVYVALVGPWVIRNRVEARFCGFSTIFADSMYYAVGGSVKAAKEGKPIEEVQRDLAMHLAVYAESHPKPGEQQAFMIGEGVKKAIRHPLTYAYIHVKGMVRTLAGLAAHGYVRLLCLLPESDDLRAHVLAGDGLMRIAVSRAADLSFAVMTVTAVLGIFAVMYYALALVGLLTKRVLGSADTTALLMAAAYLLILTGGFHGYSRYRHAIMPIVSILAGYGFSLVLERWRTRRTGARP